LVTVLDMEARQAVADLTDAVLEIRPLAERLGPPLPVGAAHDALTPVLDRVTGRLGATPLAPKDADGDDGTEAFRRVAVARLGLAELADALADAVDDGHDGLDGVDRVVDARVRADFGAFCRSTVLERPDGALVPAYAAGDPQAPAVVIASACGMPARLAERWMRRLAADHHVLTWESRALFADVDVGVGGGVRATGDRRADVPVGVAAQAGDLVAVMDHFGVATAHVAGLCGGAVVALEAAAAEPERVTSLSLWHGDLDLGPDTPKTDHQRNLQALMELATGSPEDAARLHAVVCQAILQSVPPDLAHLVLYPYVTPGLLHRYSRLNGAIMAHDVSDRCGEVTQPAVVVTSRDDSTAHPEGSRLLAAGLPRARLVVNEHGDHLSVFRGEPALLADAVRLIRDVSGSERSPA
jgi:3-oxoadipate enol-lactonase